MANKIQITNFTARDCGTAASLPSDSESEITFTNTTAINCGTGFHIRGPDSLAAQLGLPLDTPPNVIIEAAKVLRASTGTDAEKEDALRELPIWKWIKRAGSAAGAISALIAAAHGIGSFMS